MKLLETIPDPLMEVEVVSSTPNPQTSIYLAMHQDYSAGFITSTKLSETRCGEIAVKGLLKGGKGHYGCYSEDTEVLTHLGWVFWPEVTKEHHLLAVDPNTGESHFELPSKLFSYSFQAEDKMYSVKGKKIDLLVTEDHRHLIQTRRQKGWTDTKELTSQELYRTPVRHRITSNLKETKESGIPLSWFSLAGFWFGDGVMTQNIEPKCLRWRLKKTRKIDYLLSKSSLVEIMKSNHYTLRDPALTYWLYSNFTLNRVKKMPTWLLHCSQEEFEAFLEGLKNSDGTKWTTQGFAYDSCEKDSLELLQAVCATHGYFSTLTLNHPNNSNELHRPCWRITLANRSEFIRIETRHKGRAEKIEEAWVNYTGKVYCASVSTGALLVRRNYKPIVSGNCMEHPQIQLACSSVPHSVMQQFRTHRNVSFDTSSMRYTEGGILDVTNSVDYPEAGRKLEKAIYFRPEGEYTNREGNKYYYSPEIRKRDKEFAYQACLLYRTKRIEGVSEEHARGMLPFDYRQHMHMSGNLRAMLHVLELRAKTNAQLESQWLSHLIMQKIVEWCPEIGNWYLDKRFGKARLAP